MIYCYLDTNIFQEFQPITQIKWLKELNATNVCLVVTSVVVGELDKHKTGNNNRLRKRARKSISFLKSLDRQTDNQICPNVKLRFDLVEPMRDTLDEHNLSADVKDDLLIAKALEFRITHKSDKVAVLTDDAVVQFKAEGYGLHVPVLSEDLRLPHAIDPLEKENQEIRHELLRLQNSQPKLALGFRDSTGTLVNFLKASNEFSKHLISDTELDDLIQSERDALRYERDERPTNVQRISNITGSALFTRGVTNGQIEEYNDKIEDFMEDYRNYRIDISVARVFSHRSIEIDLILKNEGSTPAKNVEVRLYVNGSREILLKVPEVPPYEPSPPAKPVPWSPFELDQSSILLPRFDMGLEDIDYGRPWEEWTRETDNSGAAWFEYGIKKLQHHRSLDLETLYLLFRKCEEFPATVNVRYEVTADNMVDMLSRNLTIVVNKNPP